MKWSIWSDVESSDGVLTCCGCLPVPCNANEGDEQMTQKTGCDMQPCVWPAPSLNLDFHKSIKQSNGGVATKHEYFLS